MSPEPDETTRTPNPDDTDAPNRETSGTPEEDGRDTPKDETDYRALHLANKQTIEALTAKVSELAHQVGSRPATEPAAERGNQAEVDALITKAESLKGVDPLASLMLSERAERLQDRQDFADALVLQRLPESKQKPTLDFYLKNRHRFADLTAASEAFNGRESASRVSQLEKELADANKKLASDADGGGSKVDKDDVVRTHGVDTSTPTHKARSWTQDQYDDEYARLEREGGIRATLELQGKLRRGEILLKR